jgi:hypothetical protein
MRPRGASSGPASNGPHHHRPQADGEVVSVLSRSDVQSRDDDNMSGYSGQLEDGASSYTRYYNRLTKFYLKYNPEKLDRVEEFLKAYRGEEEQLFKLLSEKYGPEPDPPQYGSVCSTSDVGGPRLMVPKVVPRDVGYTSDDSPYWPGTKTVNDRDLCEVLETQQAGTNPNVAASYLGIIKEHPARATNGMTYVATTPVPADGSRFLGHLWAGSLANNKVLVHKGVQYHRTVLHCTELCSTAEFPHERWRLTMYRAEHTPNVLFRTVWDPEIQLEPAPFDESTNNNSFTKNSFKVQYATRRRPGSEAGSGSPVHAPPPQQPAQPGQPVGVAGAPPMVVGGQPTVGPPNGGPAPHVVSGHRLVFIDPMDRSIDSSNSSMPANYQQPQQPMALGPLDIVLHHIQQMEQRLTMRLHSLEERLLNIETALLEPDQPMP